MMRKDLFAELLESVKEMKAIQAGRVKPCCSELTTDSCQYTHSRWW